MDFTTVTKTHQDLTADHPKLRLLYFVGAGPGASKRVDVAHLFGEQLTGMGMEIEWYMRSREPGGPLMHSRFYGAPAWVSGQSRMPGSLGRALTKLQEFAATSHFFIKSLFGNHDIIQVRDDFLAGPLGLLAAAIRRKPFVFWLSYPFPDARRLDAREGRARFPLYARSTASLSDWSLRRLLIPGSDHVFLQSQQMIEDVAGTGSDRGNLSAVPMGLPDRDLPRLEQSEEEDLVLYLGTLAAVRRLEVLLDAFAIIAEAAPQARMVIVGDGDRPAERQALIRRAAELGLADRVTFTGALPRVDALQWVKKAAVCVSPFYPTPILRSTSPTKLVEYMAMGKAVVANDHPEQAEVLAQSGAGVCVPWDAAAFAEAVLRLLGDPDARREAGVRGHEWVARNRLYSRISSDLMIRYRQIHAEYLLRSAD